MRVALITLEHPIAVAGRALALRQLDFALAAGATRVIGLGDPFAPGAVALRLEAERQGLRFQHAANGQALLGATGTGDELLVIAPGLLPEAWEVLELLARGPGVPVLPAAAGAGAGFERIDQQDAWAGVLLMPGGLVEQLAVLEPGFDPAATLLRIALQARVPRRALPADVLAGGTWVMLPAADVATIESGWLARHLPAAEPWPLAGRIVRALVTRRGAALLADDRSRGLALGGAVALPLAGLLAAKWYWPATALLLLGGGALAQRLWQVLRGLGRTALDRAGGGRDGPVPLAVSWLLDLALALVVAQSVPGATSTRYFPAAVLVLVLRQADQWRDWRGMGWLRDRLAVALVLALAALAGMLDSAVMLAVLAILAIRLSLGPPQDAGSEG